jgi:hypothetical protein
VSEPTTAAGKAFALFLRREEDSFDWDDARRIAAIEAEARADALAEVATAVEAAQAVVSAAEPDANFDGEFVDYLVAYEPIEALREALRLLKEKAS